MTNLTKFTTSSLFAYGVIFASKANAGGASAGWGANDKQPNGVPTDLEATVMNITNWILGFVFLIAVLMIIFGGVMYLTSAGSQDATDKAKKTIMYALIGLAVVLLAWVLISTLTSLLGTAVNG